MGYAKLYSFQDSSIMELDVVIRFIFLFMLGEADFNGVFDGSPESLARRANVPLKDMQRALDVFQKPDPQSKSKLEEGRRIIYQGSNKWWMVNYVEYRTKQEDDGSYQKLQWRLRAARKAAVDKGEELDEAQWMRDDALKRGIEGKFTGVHDYTDADTDTDSNTRSNSSNTSIGNKRFVPPTEQEVGEYMVQRHEVKPTMAASEAKKFIGFYEGRDWYTGNHKMKSWRGAVAYWCGNLDKVKLSGNGILRHAAKADHLRRKANEVS